MHPLLPKETVFSVPAMSAAQNAILAAAGLLKRALEAVTDPDPAPAAARTFVWAKENLKEMKLSGTKFRQMLRAGEDIPEWFAFKSVVKVLRGA